MILPGYSLTLFDLSLEVPGFEIDHIEEVLKLGRNNLQGCVRILTGPIFRTRGSQGPNSGT
jgi:hypothetical protein